jgi:hypothetical protein
MSSKFGIIYSANLGKAYVVDNNHMRYTRLRKAIYEWARIIVVIPDTRMVMLTLTYRPGEEWSRLDISEYLLKLKKKLKNKLLAYAWVAELQERGAVHYHIIVVCKKTAYIPMPDKSGMWKKGNSNYKKAKTAYYIVAYTKKKYQKDYDKFPAYCHAFAVYVSDKALQVALRENRLPEWKKEIKKKYGNQADEIIAFHKEDCGWCYRSCSEKNDAEGWKNFYMSIFIREPIIPF